ncbi:hypothetical protein [Fibrobacter sp. UWEL]|uniref:hypothetical protein n=1 Tax=Fibrobacter sp. UWEL TaxID=1896209 RepID=UPI00091FFC78|nr:hypothetical protein [Fibrobacter sp. UWEL]SHK79879.1 hypothetical protein SAMN05720468_10724 [Fibrobacter sp. UWEL]
MKKLLVLATIALCAAFTACSDAKNSVAPSFENDTAVSYSEEHMFTSCRAAADTNAVIDFDFDAVNGTSTLTRTYHHDFMDGAEAACAAVKKNAVSEEKINCTDTAVEIVTEFQNLTADDYRAMVETDCWMEK